MSQHRVTLFFDSGAVDVAIKWLHLLGHSAADHVDADLVGWDFHTAVFNADEQTWQYEEIESTVEEPSGRLARLGPIERGVPLDVGEAL